MSWNSRRKSSKFVNVLLVLICIVLVVILGGLLMTNRKEVQQESERLQELSEKQETGIDDYEAVKEHVSELEQEAEEETEESPKEDPDEKKKESTASMLYTPSKTLDSFLQKISATASKGTPINQLDKRLELLKY